ncbi:MAG TPA: arylsulfatase [Planctomycetaceae bacterium]|nr:arylsulfatase [Planctomycetaceae bacterium]
MTHRFLGLLGLFSVIAAAAVAQEPPRPNIVLILADDLGYGDLGCYGQTVVKTPRLDRLAAEGMRFTQFYAGSTVCAPSRCVLMTGKHTGHCYIRGNSKLNLPPEEVTVAEVAKSAGYATSLVGKWGLGHEGSHGVPTQQGFDRFFGYLDQHHAHNFFPAYLMSDEARFPLQNVVPGDGEFGVGVATVRMQYSPDLLIDEALGFIDTNKDRPFFLYFASTLPHANNEGKNKGMEIPSVGDYERETWPEPQKGLAAMISRLDTDVGRLLDRLAHHKLDDRTLVLFSSDNGPHREGGNDPDFFNSNGPLRGIKRDLTDGGIRVPFLARWPGRIPAGKINDAVGWFADLMPTVAELVGAPSPSNLDGVSLKPALLGQPWQRAADKPLYWEFYERPGQAVRIGDWKVIRRPLGGDTYEVYNLRDDLGETRDLAAQQPDVVARARQLMDQSHVASPLWKVREK